MNSKKAQAAFSNFGCTVFPIPPRLPDINPIDIVREKLKTDVRVNKISKESFDELAERVRKTIMDFSEEVIDKTIDTMINRTAFKKRKGYRTKY